MCSYSHGLRRAPVHDSQDHDLVIAHGVMYNVRKLQQRDPPDARSLRHFLSAFRELADPLDTSLKPSLKSRRRPWIFGVYMGENSIEFGECETRIADLHVRRYLANTASTSSSLAT
jgi:hypothetical protein